MTIPAVAYLWYDATTASAVRAEPSANLALGRMWNVTERAVRFTSQLEASHGSGTRVVAEGTARESYTRECRIRFAGLVFSGFESRTEVVATTSVSPYSPPGLCAAAGGGARDSRTTAAARAVSSVRRTLVMPFLSPSPGRAGREREGPVYKNCGAGERGGTPRAIRRNPSR